MRSSLVLVALCVCLVALLATPVEGIFRKGGAQHALEVQHLGVAAAKCSDVRPKGSEQYTCQQQKEWGKCSASWMTGFCMLTCGKCSPAPPTPVKPPTPTPAISPLGINSLAALNINAPASRTAPFRSVSPLYKDRKNKILAALRASGMGEARARLCLAIAILETNSFDPEDRDKTKTGDSTNYSQWNINLDMMRRQNIDYSTFNDWSALPAISDALNKMITAYGVNGFLNYMRGGWTGWQDGVTYGCADYRNAVASMVKMLDTHAELLTNDQRIDMDVAHV